MADRISSQDGLFHTFLALALFFYRFLSLSARPALHRFLHAVFFQPVVSRFLLGSGSFLQ
ncbi:hypothetical protein [Prevotella multiformis]|uniref:hypothetical protein n=1 Tax=Prevotella multiformis TaxID=282402 RepID=UPI0023F58E58|nr:hypothetical protein [Prevotella multiformis]